MNAADETLNQLFQLESDLHESTDTDLFQFNKQLSWINWYKIVFLNLKFQYVGAGLFLWKIFNLVQKNRVLNRTFKNLGGDYVYDVSFTFDNRQSYSCIFVSDKIAVL